LLDSVRRDLVEIGADDLVLTNGRSLYFVLDVIIFIGATGRDEGAGRPLVFGAQSGNRAAL
jgi:hypothetical protein